MKQEVDHIHEDKDFYISFDPPENLEITTTQNEKISLTEVSRLYFCIDLKNNGSLEKIEVFIEAKYIGNIDELLTKDHRMKETMDKIGYLRAGGAFSIDLVEFKRILSYHKLLYTNYK